MRISLWIVPPRLGLIRMSKRPGIRVRWSKRERDLVVDWDQERCKANPRYVLGLFSQEVTDELTQRGFDVTSLRFSISRQDGWDAGQQQDH